MPHILLVEDNPIDARLIHRMFRDMKDWSSKITWLDDGQKALQYVNSLDEGNVPDPPELVLLDINLPKFSGIDVLTAIRQSENLCNLPVFLISSASEVEIEETVQTSGLQVDGYLVKPFGLLGFQEIAKRVREYLEQRCCHFAFENRAFGMSSCSC